MPNINTSGPPITNVNKLKLFGMDENEEVGWILSNSLAPVYVGSVAELESLSLEEEVNVYLTQDGRAGEFVIKSGTPPSDPQKGIYIVLANGNYAERVDLSFVTPEMFGAMGNGVSDDAEALSHAIDLTSQLGIVLHLKNSTYIVSLQGSTLDWAGAGPMHYVFILKDNVRIVSEPGGEIKLRDGESTRDVPKNWAMFLTTVNVSNIYIEGVIFNSNGFNNLIAPPDDPINSRNNCATFHATSKTGAGISNFTSVGCTYKETPGSTCICISQGPNGAIYELPTDIKIIGNKFINNGFDTHDHSCVYALANRVLCKDNYFYQDPAVMEREGRNWVSFEVHGSDTWFVDNIVSGFYRGCWVASNSTETVERVYVCRNTFKVWGCGPSFFRQLSSMTEIRDVFICENVIELDETDTLLAIKAAIEINAYYSISGIVVSDNIVKAASAMADSSALIVIAGAAVNPLKENHGSIIIQNNTVTGTTCGVYARTYDNSHSFDFIKEEGNTYIDLVEMPHTFGSVYEAHSTAPIMCVTSINNTYIQNSPTVNSTSIPVRLVGPITTVEVDGIKAVGWSATSPSGSNNYCAFSTLLSDNRKGSNLLIGTVAPTTGNWNRGDTFVNWNPTRIKNIHSWMWDGVQWRVRGGGYGSTGERPALTSNDAGFIYYDTTLTKSLVWTGSSWV